MNATRNVSTGANMSTTANAKRNASVANQTNASSGTGTVSNASMTILLAITAPEAMSSMPRTDDVVIGVLVSSLIPHVIGGHGISHPSPHSVVNSNQRITLSTTQPHVMPFAFLVGSAGLLASTTLGGKFLGKVMEWQDLLLSLLHVKQMYMQGMCSLTCPDT